MPTVFENIASIRERLNLNASLSVSLSGISSFQQILDAVTSGSASASVTFSGKLQSTPLTALDAAPHYNEVLSQVRQLLSGQPGDFATTLSTGFLQTIGAEFQGLQGQFSALLKFTDCFSDLMDLVEKLAGGTLQSPNSSTSPLSNRSALRSRRVARASETPGLAGDIERFIALLGLAPAQADFDSWFALFEQRPQALRREIPSAYLPWLDEFSRMIRTLNEWRSLSEVQIGGKLEATLLSLANFIEQRMEAVSLPLAQLIGQFSVPNILLFEQSLKDLGDGLNAYHESVSNNDAPSVQAALLALEDAHVRFGQGMAALETLFSSGIAGQLQSRVLDLPATAGGELLFVLNTLSPPPTGSLLFQATGNFQAEFDPTPLQKFADEFAAMLTRLSEAFEEINTSSLQQGLQSASDAVDSALKAVDDGLIEAIGRLSFIFDEIEETLTSLDTSALTDALKNSLADFGQLVRKKIDDFFHAFKNAISDALSSLDAALNSFDPDSIKDVLKNAIVEIAQTLNDPELIGALNNFKQTFESVGNQFEEISFKAPADVIVGQIEAITAILQKIDPDSLSFPVKSALSAAVVVLPSESEVLDIKGSMLMKLDDMTLAAPVALLQKAVDIPAQIQAQLLEFSPSKLVGDTLSEPFQQVLQTIEEIKPTQLLAPVDSALISMKNQLSAQASPVVWMQPVESAFDSFTSQLDNLKPESLVEPLQKMLDSAVETMLDAVPLEAALTQLGTFFDRVQSWTSAPLALRNLLEKAAEVAGNFSNFRAESDQWFDAIVQKIQSIPPTVNLDEELQQVRLAIEQTKAQAILDKFMPALSELSEVLQSIDIQARMTNIIRGSRDFSAAALATFPQNVRDEAQQFFGNFNPLSPNVNSLVQQTTQLSANLSAGVDNIEAHFQEWDSRYHAANSPFNLLFPNGLDLAAAKTMLVQTIEQELKKPLNTAFELVGPFAQTLNKVLEKVDDFLGNPASALSFLIQLPTALSSMNDAMKAILDRVKSLNLDFLIQELDAIFLAAKAKLDSLHPRHLRQVMQGQFEQMLGLLSFNTLLPANTFANLEAQLSTLLEKLKALDPKVLIAEVLDPEFKRLIEPLLAVFDLTPLVESFLLKLEPLKASLDLELTRIAGAYGVMLDAMPSLDLSIDIDLDVGASIGF